MSQLTVMLTNPIHPKALAMLDARHRVVTSPDTSADTLRKVAQEADAILVRTLLPGDILDHAPRVRTMVRHGVGLDFIPVDEATKRGVPVANVPGANTLAVVEHVLGLMLLMARQYHRLDQLTRQGDWECRNRLTSFELKGETLGILGMGRIGCGLATLCNHGLGMKVLGYDPFAKDMPEGVRPASVEEIFQQSRFVSLHVPLTADTKNLVDNRLLATMRPEAYLINACRGAVVVEEDLIQALNDKIIAGAALDVFNQEPLPSDHPFMKIPNLVITPHSAALTDGSIVRMGTESVAELLSILDLQKPVNLVNPDAWPAYVAKYGK
ncbi:hydroxyacid dehydrogenase [Desulfoferula mesophila]|uniref:Dehydrogenase n=1 Tax=Desulfoferula mesophila TaxID=3058419 RepID=A0AAU9E9C5_9BACT|nr:dehydrogenase [Desulfoferula mesophilus]